MQNQVKQYGHGAIIQNAQNNRQMLDSMIKKNSINSGRTRVQMNSTTIRENNASNGGRLIIKKTISPGIDSSNFQPNLNQTMTVSNQNKQPSQDQLSRT